MAGQTSLLFWLFNTLFLCLFFLCFIGKALWERSCKTKVAKLDLAEAIDEDVCRLQVSVDDIGRGKELASTQHVI